MNRLERENSRTSPRRWRDIVFLNRDSLAEPEALDRHFESVELAEAIEMLSAALEDALDEARLEALPVASVSFEEVSSV